MKHSIATKQNIYGSQITVSEYLLQRLKSFSLKHIFGVPGDYNLSMLDYVEADNDIQWVGNCNELNAAYAADGYARLNGLGAIITTFGVGELSAINGIAGSYTEHVPVVHIVGAPTCESMQKNQLLHHTLHGKNSCVFLSMSEHVTSTQAVLTSSNAASEIDRVLLHCWQQKQPVYIVIPCDVATSKIASPHFPLQLKQRSDNTSLALAISAIKKKVEAAKKPLVIVDIGVDRQNLKNELTTFINKFQLPFVSTIMGKGIIDETNENYRGLYQGAMSDALIQKTVNDSDCVVSFGLLLSDFNSGGFSVEINKDQHIEIHRDYCLVTQHTFKDVYMPDVLMKMTDVLDMKKIPYSSKHLPASMSSGESQIGITQTSFWQAIQQFLKPNDIMLSEAGTSLFSALDLQLPKNTAFISQLLWSSIGYTLAALLGACLAAPGRRSLLFIGDGSFQLTAQAISTMIRVNAAPIIFVINNKGYTVEKAIHGETKNYNNIQNWQYSELPKIFGGNILTQRVSTINQLETVLQTTQSLSGKLILIEVIMPEMCIPKRLQQVSIAIKKQNKVE